MTYEEIKEIVTQNPDITAEEFGEKLKENRINIKRANKYHYTLLGHIVNSEGPNITDNTNDRAIFLQIIKLLTDLKTKGNTGQLKYVKAGLSEAITTKQADVVRIFLDSGKFNEEEKFDALLCAVTQKYVQGVKLLLGHVNDENVQKALKVAMDKEQTTQVEEIIQVLLNFITPETPNVEENGAKPCSSNGSIGSRPVATAPPVSTKYKESKKDFYTSLTKDIVGVVITGLFIAAAVMVPYVAGAVVCGVIAALVAIGTGLHIKNSTWPSYREIKENEIGYVSSKTEQTLRFEKNLH
ncbi:MULTISPECIES: hypothetical protein [Wolbachia]|uniref:Ankyrin repeat domain-containing protein n=1 Tax=Wolbachia pipientis TaxID=955 RepID=A0A7G5CD12_WOLPI|nr:MULTISPECIES: hypothetical protein [Wolbachia]MDE5061542.1 hypothetical protein [Wolbachia endosymbiont of Drosophila nikananu]QMV47096.1 hypothetical protein HC356_03430 [Wolbachia pipientis]